MIGIDEVGRGCLAGPLLVVAAEASASLPAGLADSKQLSALRRNEIYKLLLPVCRFGEGWVGAEEISQLGLSAAMRLGVKRALDKLQVATDAPIVIDGHINYCPKKFTQVRAIIKGDQTVSVISAASIYAKVTRDAYMKSADIKYAGYGFSQHVGYGTAAHLLAIKKLGVIKDFHRLNYLPIKKAMATL